MHHPLPDGRSVIFFDIGAHGADDPYDQGCESGDEQNRLLVFSKQRQEVIQPPAGGFVSQQVVEDDFQRPGLQKIGNSFADGGG
jgi:hypothetical protein